MYHKCFAKRNHCGMDNSFVVDLSVSHKNYKDETLTHSSMEEEESGLDEDDTEVLEACDGGAGVKHQAITGRGITLSMLMQDGLIEPGENCMSIEYLVCKDNPSVH